MNTRPISILALAQLLTLSFAFLVAATAGRAVERIFEYSHLSPDLSFSWQSPFTFQQYSWLLLILVTAWLFAALDAERRHSRCYSVGTIVFGVSLLIAFFAYTVFFAVQSIAIYSSSY